MRYIEYMGFSGVPYRYKGKWCADVCDMASQVLTIGGDTMNDLKLSLYEEVDRFYGL